MKPNAIFGGVLFLAGAAGAYYGFKVVAESDPFGKNPEFWTGPKSLSELRGPVQTWDRDGKPSAPTSGIGGVNELTSEAQLYRWGPVGLAVIGLVIAIV